MVILGGRLTAWEAATVLGNANLLTLESPALDVWNVLLVVCYCGEWRIVRIVSTNQKSLLLLELLLGLLLLFSGQGVIRGANTGAQ